MPPLHEARGLLYNIPQTRFQSSSLNLKQCVPLFMCSGSRKGSVQGAESSSCPAASRGGPQLHWSFMPHPRRRTMATMVWLSIHPKPLKTLQTPEGGFNYLEFFSDADHPPQSEKGSPTLQLPRFRDMRLPTPSSAQNLHLHPTQTQISRAQRCLGLSLQKSWAVLSLRDVGNSE